MKNIIGSDMLVTANPTAEIPRLDIEKFRSRNSGSGTRGSLLVLACCQMNSPSTATPVRMSPHTVIGPQMTPQS